MRLSSGERMPVDAWNSEELIVMETRASNYADLIAYFEARTFDPVDPSIERYAAVADEFFDDQRVGAKIGLFASVQEAFEFLGESVLEGYGADGVYDLDTAEKIYVEVSTPIVKRGKDQGFNPLAE